MCIKGSPVVREEVCNQSAVRKTPLLVNVYSGEKLGSKRPWARDVHGKVWQRIGQKTLDGAGKGKKCKNITLEKKPS